MITIPLSTKKIESHKADCLVFFVQQDFDFSKELSHYADLFFPHLQQLMKNRKFTGKALSSLLVPVCCDDEMTNLLFIGLGKTPEGKKKIDVEVFRRALGKVIRVAEGYKFSSLVMQAPSGKLFGVTAQYCGKQIMTILSMAAYKFDKYLTEDKDKQSRDFAVTLITSAQEKNDYKRGIKEGTCIADAVNNARHWIDSPGLDMPPKVFANNARKIAKKNDLKITVFDGKKIAELGMGGIVSVGRGSAQDTRFVIMEYTAKKKNSPTIGLVGKGITFDSGGLSLKPPSSMETMKDDMSGAAAVIATMEALAILKPSVNVVAIAALAENMTGSDASRPGDIIRFYNGKTAEVLNTDAEGRLVLADALSYAVKNYKLDALIDLATLTGACLYALGPFFCGLMSQHDDLAKKVQKASDASGDRVWPLPFHDDYKPAIKSHIADIKNIGDKKYMAGTTTAGFFLQNFVGDVPWVHLDIAGTAFNVPDLSYFRPGATGFGVRLLVELVMNWK